MPEPAPEPGAGPGAGSGSGAEPGAGSGWTITVDRHRCMGTGTCTVYAPQSIELDPEGKAVVLEPVADDLEAARNAVESCPTEALAIAGRER